jgi:predicted DNA-binding transcriptional regulator AlpA
MPAPAEPHAAAAEAERRWLAGDATALRDVLLRRRPGQAPHAGDLIVGMTAPELHALTMLTVTDIAKLANVSKSTIDSYRYRGYLPQPQMTRSRTPLWARPIVNHWLHGRPGSGWRTDVHITHDMADPTSQRAASATAAH